MTTSTRTERRSVTLVTKDVTEGRKRPVEFTACREDKARYQGHAVVHGLTHQIANRGGSA
jgi:hypothetical protein